MPDLVDLDGALSVEFLAIQENSAVICLVDTGQQIEMVVLPAPFGPMRP